MNTVPQILDLTAARAEASAPWPKPRPFTRHAAPALDLDKCLPPGLDQFRKFCRAVAESLQVPPDAVAPLALALASIGTSRALEVELAAQWRETAPLWFAVLAEPGERKSALLGLLAAPVHDWQAEQREYLKHALAQYAERRRVIEARMHGVRQKLQRATGPDVGKLERDALNFAADLERLPILAAPELITSNATPEAVRDLLCRNGEKLAIVSAETDAGQLMGSRYAKTGGANIDLFLSAFTGEPAPSHRVGRDAPLARPALAMVLCVQPEAVAAMLRDIVARGRGFVDRLCLIQPESRMGSRILHPASVPPDLLQWWGQTLRRLLDLKWPGRVMLTPDGPARCERPPNVLRLAHDAEAVFDALRLDLESRIGEGGDLRPVCGFASKLPGVIARLALTMQAMQDPEAERITRETMQAACGWSAFLLGHSRVVRGDAAEGDDVKLARRLLAAIKRHELAELTARDAHRLIDTGQTAGQVAEALDVLLDAEWLREPPAPLAELRKAGGRPPSPRFQVNPTALDG